jgi:predicted ATPase
VFVSSTLEELAAERAAARRAVEELRFIPVLFELGARPHPPRALYRAYLEQSHVFVGIYWQRYGWVAPGMEISGLEDEHELAAGTGIPKLVYVKRPAGERDPRLQRMLERVAASGVSYRGFETPDELADLLRDDLALLVSERFAREAPTVAGGHVAIPAPVSSFVRRDVRLVTLTGAGGIGKTRLAFEAARGVVDAFSHGVVAVLLASLTDSEEVLPAVAEALGVTMGADTSVAESLREHLAAREVLLVLDNMEHVLAAAPAVGDLLAGAAGVTVLATSRARLDVSGEHVFRVSPLPLPTAGERDPDAIRRSDSVRLFTTRAAAAGWTTDDADLEIVSAIVRALDGLPLAIELAAAQARLVPAELIHARLRRRLDLAGGPRDADERHRTLRSTIGWSYDLLDEPARRFLAALAVFSGGFSIDAAGAVVDRGVDVEELLASLVDASLVTTGPSPVTGVRFGMLETIREYAGEKLEELGLTAETVARHLAYFAQLADDAADAPPEERGAARGRLDEERENLRVALQEALRTNAAEAVRLAGALGTFFSQRGLNREGREIIARALAAAPEAPAGWRARALVHGAWLAAEQDEFTEADRIAHEALDLYRSLGDDRGVGMCFNTLGYSAATREDAERAIAYYERAQQAFARTGQDHLRHFAAGNVATVLANTGRLDEARRLYGEALAYFEAHGFEDQAAIVQYRLGELEENAGDLEVAREWFEASAAVARRNGNQRLLAWAVMRLGHLAAAAGRIDDAGASYAEALDLHDELGQPSGVAQCLEYLARVALTRGEWEVAAELLGAARTRREATGVPVSELEQPEVTETEKEAHARLGDDGFEHAVALGAALGQRALRARVDDVLSSPSRAR